jgi:hypothetical protein
MYNTIDTWRLTVTIIDGDRAAFWEVALGTRTLPVVMPVPVLALDPGLGVVKVYFLDVMALSAKQIERVTRLLAEYLEVSQAAAAASVWAPLPILAENTIVTVTGGEVKL